MRRSCAGGRYVRGLSGLQSFREGTNVWWWCVKLIGRTNGRSVLKVETIAVPEREQSCAFMAKQLPGTSLMLVRQQKVLRVVGLAILGERTCGRFSFVHTMGSLVLQRRPNRGGPIKRSLVLRKCPAPKARPREAPSMQLRPAPSQARPLFFVSSALVSLSLSVTRRGDEKTKRGRRCCTAKLTQGET